jgi:hypothetical protein
MQEMESCLKKNPKSRPTCHEPPRAVTPKLCSSAVRAIMPFAVCRFISKSPFVDFK